MAIPGTDGCPGGGGVDAQLVADSGDGPAVFVEAGGESDALSV